MKEMTIVALNNVVTLIEMYNVCLYSMCVAIIMTRIRIFAFGTHVCTHLILILQQCPIINVSTTRMVRPQHINTAPAALAPMNAAGKDSTVKEAGSL